MADGSVVLTSIDLLKIALTSGASAAIITAIANGYFKKLDYKRDYYKKIIERRLNVYEEVENIIGEFYFVRQKDKDGNKTGSYYSCMSTLKKKRRTMFKIRLCLKHKIWLSKSMREEISLLNSLLLKYKNADTVIYQKEIIAAHDKIHPIRNKMQEMLTQDLLELHDVEGFLKSDKKEHKKEILNAIEVK